MSLRLKTMFKAFQIGKKDRELGVEPSFEKHCARVGSAWYDWYMEGYNGDAFRQELVDAGFKE